MTNTEYESTLSSLSSTSRHELCPGGGIKNLPDPDEFPGVKFILESIKPPRLIDHNGPTNKRYMRYYERDQCHRWWFQRWFSWAPYWFTFFWYCSTKGDRVSCTRDELRYAWVKGLNGARYHQVLHRYAGTITNQQIKIKYKTTIDDLAVMAKKWLSLFREIDWALGILYQMQINRDVPKYWRYYQGEHQYDLNNLSKWKHHLTCVSTAADLTGCFIHCAREIIRLESKGYNKGFEELAMVIGFTSHKVCEIPGVPNKFTYDDDILLTGN